MAEAVVSIALETFRDLLLEEGKFFVGIGREVKALQTQLKEIKCLLKDADRKQHESESVRNWIAEIRDLAYRAEDVIASYAVQASSDARGRGLKRVLRRFSSVSSCCSLYQLDHEISNIKSELAGVTKSMKDYGIRSIIDGAESSPANNNQNWTRKTFPNFEIGECFVGKEDELKRLAYLVGGDDKQHRVISVWGMGGIGKTTVVKKVYNKMIRTKEFDSFAWVCITQQCRIRGVLEGVFKQLDPQKADGVLRLSDEQLIEQLCEVQRAKRCLIVLDDLWEISHWIGFKHAFLVDDLKSKIVVTTRKQNVAEVGFTLQLGLLNIDEALELLKKKSFPHSNNQDFASQEKFDKFGKEMVRKCGYLPLTISLLGGVLSKKIYMDDWDLVRANINSSIYRGEGHDRKDDHIEQVLNLSYQDLPYYLKPCFLYLGRLREDEIIDVDELYLMWVAQGMISYENIRGNEKTLMEIAEVYLSELASRCMVQVEVEVEDNLIPLLKYQSCKLHDVVRELCLSMGKKEDFGVQTLEYQDGKFSNLVQKDLMCNKTRHLTIHFQRELQLEGDDLEIACEEDTSKQYLRSLEIRSHIYGKTAIEFPKQSIVDLLKFKMLKSLVIVGFKFGERKLPRGITNLVHLKCLRLQKCELDELPSSISDLAYLDTLCLLRSWNIQVPSVLQKMFRLKHLILPYYNKRSVGNYRLRLDLGDELETLMWFDSSIHELSINKMNNLRRFSGVIRDNESLSTIINVIATEWTKLQYCVISINQGCKLTSEEGVTKLKQVFTCPNLYYLHINVELGKQLAECESDIISSKLVWLSLLECEIEDDPMVILGKLPALKYLQLLSGSFVGEELTCLALNFPRLKMLVLSHLPKWKEWRVEEGAMPVLSEIQIGYCTHFRKLPNGLSRISTLKKLKISGMPELGKGVLESGEDFHKVGHVPSIIIED